MRKLTKQDKANTVAARWKRQYYYSDAKEWDIFVSNKEARPDDIYDRIIALGPNPDPASINIIIGNKSWTILTCHCCSKEVDEVVEVYALASDEYGPNKLCANCIREMVDTLEEKEKTNEHTD